MCSGHTDLLLALNGQLNFTEVSPSPLQPLSPAVLMWEGTLCKRRAQVALGCLHLPFPSSRSDQIRSWWTVAAQGLVIPGESGQDTIGKEDHVLQTLDTWICHLCGKRGRVTDTALTQNAHSPRHSLKKKEKREPNAWKNFFKNPSQRKPRAFTGTQWPQRTQAILKATGLGFPWCKSESHREVT